MTDTLFCKTFKFRLYEYNKFRMTDNRNGTAYHFLARMNKGTARICTGLESVKLGTGDYFFIPQGLKYKSYWYPDENGELSFYSFGFKQMPSFHSYKLQRLEMTEPALKIFKELTENMTVCPKTVGLLYGCIGELEDVLHHGCLDNRDELLYNALEHIRFNTEATAKETADRVGISESGLYLLFRKKLNKTPAAVKREIQTEKAAELLCTTDLSVEEISRKLGFSSSSYFRKILRSETGKTPTEIRKRSRAL